MSFNSLLDSTALIRRKNNSDTNDYGEVVSVITTIADNVLCSRQVGPGNNMRQNIENKAPGSMNYKLVRYYFPIDTDIKEGDLITCTHTKTGKIYNAVVRDGRDAAGKGHHLEILAEETKPQGEADTTNG